MAEWEKVNLDQFVPAEIRTLAGEIAAVVGPIADIMDVTADIIDASSVLMLGFTNPILALTAALKTEIENFIADLRDAGVYLLPVAPINLTDKKGFDAMLRDIQLSFDDLADPDRPIFSPSADVVGYVFMYGHTDLKFLYNSFLKQAQDIFDLGELKDFAWADSPGVDYIPPRIERTANARQPDWKDSTVSEVFPPVGVALTELQKAVEAFFPGEGVQDFLSQLALAMKAKATQLQDIADTLDDIADELDALFQLPDIWFVKIGPTTGVDAWREQLNAASNRPPYRKDVHYVASVVAFTGGPDISALESLLG